MVNGGWKLHYKPSKIIAHKRIFAVVLGQYHKILMIIAFPVGYDQSGPIVRNNIIIVIFLLVPL